MPLQFLQFVTFLNQSPLQNTSNVDSVSYDMPEQLYADYSLVGAGSAGSSFVTNDYGSGQIEPEPANQSTPKKKQSQRFTTKVEIFVDSH